MNAAEFSLRVFEASSGGKADDASPALRSAIDLGISDILAELAATVYNSPQRASLEKLYSPTLTSGAVDLTAVGFSDLYWGSLQTAKVAYDPSGSNIPVEFYSNSKDIELPGVAGLYRGSLIANTYVVRDETGNAPANATLSMRMSWIPTLVTLASTAPHLHNDAVQAGAAFALRWIKGQQQAMEVA